MSKYDVGDMSYNITDQTLYILLSKEEEFRGNFREASSDSKLQ